MSATRPSGWCSDSQGACSSKGLHAICADRIANGLLDGCTCHLHDNDPKDD